MSPERRHCDVALHPDITVKVRQKGRRLGGFYHTGTRVRVHVRSAFGARAGDQVRAEVVKWLKLIAQDDGMTYERRFKAIEILIVMGEL